MSKRRFTKSIIKRLLASALAVTLLTPTTGISMCASSVSEIEESKQYNPYIVKNLQKLCKEGENAIDILDDLREKGIIDENAMPLDVVFDVEGKKMTADELAEEAKDHETGTVNINGEDVTWAELKRLIAIREAVQFLEDKPEITEENAQQYIDNLESLNEQLDRGEISLYGSAESSTYGAGISHQARITVTPDRTVLWETGYSQQITVTVSLITEQNVPVTLRYQTLSGSAKAEGSGTVTIPAGETTARFNVTYYGNKDLRNGESLFYITCSDVQNALIEGGESGGKNITIPITVRKNDRFVYEHDIPGRVTQGKPKITYIKKKKRKKFAGFTYKTITYYIPVYHNYVTCTLDYNDLKQLTWNDNIYNFTYTRNPIYSGGAINVEGQGSFSEYIGRKKNDELRNKSWSYKTHAYRQDVEIEYYGGISSNMHVKEVHEFVRLESLNIPNGNFYVGQTIPISATFSEYINIDNSICLRLLDGTVLTPQETGTVGNSCTFLYKIPEVPNAQIPRITELSLNDTTSYSGDRLKISGQNDNYFHLEELATANPSQYVIENKGCKLNYYKDASLKTIWCGIDDNLPGKQWVTEVITLHDGPDHVYREWVQDSGVDIQELNIKSTKYLQSGEETQKALEGTPYQEYSDPSKYSVKYYSKCMYLSVDGGEHKVPFYIIAKLDPTDSRENEAAVALVARYRAKLNTKKEPITEATEVFMDPQISCTYDYLQGEKKAELLFSQTSRCIPVPQLYSVKNAVFTYPGAASINYNNENPFLSDWSKIVEKPEDLKTYHIEYDGNLEHIRTENREEPTYVESDKKENTHSSINRKDEDEKDKILMLKEESEEEEGKSIVTKQYEMQNPVVTKGFRVETDELSITAEFGEEDFTFIGTKNLIWVSSDESVATVKYPDEYLGKKAETYGADHKATVEIIPTGKVGHVYFTLYALNGDMEGYTPVEVCRSVTLFCEPGKEPYLKIPSKKDTTPVISGNQKEPLDVCFISNLTFQNAEEANKSFNLGKFELPDYPTEFKMDVYEADFKGEMQGKPVYSTSVISTNKNTVGKITIPKGILKRVSSAGEIKYIAKISADSLKSRVTGEGPLLEKERKTAVVGITVIAAPPSLSLKTLDKYSILDETKQKISYSLDMHGAPILSSSLTITDSKGNVVLSQALEEGEQKLVWNTGRIKEKLKEVYKVKTTVQYKDDEPEIVDSYILNVYNHEAIDILVNAVDGKNVPGKTDPDEITWDNHSKVKSLISADGKTITLDGKKVSLVGLSEDINLASMISINYGDYVWGLISDRITWDVKDDTKDDTKKRNLNKSEEEETATTLNMLQGGLYADINSYDYVSYSPVKNFMAVGLQDGKTKITATHANTGMKSSITITSKTLKNQLYLFKFIPKIRTKLEYKNGKGENCVVETDMKGELALYEESGIASDIHVFSSDEEGDYVGTIPRKNIMSGEQDVSQLQNYPINNYKLRCVSNVKIYVTDENGAPYANKKLWIRGGVYKNLDYCYSALLGKQKDHLSDGKVDQEFQTDSNGNINIYFDSSQFYTMKEETIVDRVLNGDDSITYSIEIKFQLDKDVENVSKVYEPQIVHISSTPNELESIDDCTANVQARKVECEHASKSAIISPVVNAQYYGQCDSSGRMCNAGNLYGYNGSIGVSKQYPIVKVETESLFWGYDVIKEKLVYKDKDGVEISYGSIAKKVKDNEFKVFHINPQDVQFDHQKTEVITYEFADMPVVKTCWTMLPSEIKKLVPEDKIVPINLGFQVKGVDNFVKEIVTGFNCITKISSDPLINNFDTKEQLQHLLDWTDRKLDWISNTIEQEISKNTLMSFAMGEIKQFMVEADKFVDVQFTPTSDPTRFRAVASLSGQMGGGFEDTGWKAVANGIRLGKRGYKTASHLDAEHAISAARKTMCEWNWTYSKDQLDKQMKYLENRREYAEFSNHWFHLGGHLQASLDGLIYLEFRCNDYGKWACISTGGSFGCEADASIWTAIKLNIGPAKLKLNLGAYLDGEANILLDGDAGYSLKKLNAGAKVDCYTDANADMSLDVFLGRIFGCNFLGAKFGVYGTLTTEFGFRDLFYLDADLRNLKLDYGNQYSIKNGINQKLYGEVGLRWVLHFLWFSKRGDIPIIKHSFKNDVNPEYELINNLWNRRKQQEVEFCSSDFSLESRDYLAMKDRAWVGGSVEQLEEQGESSTKLVQSNAYTFCEPVYNDDGSIIAYLSDSDSSNVEDTLASYAILENGSYVNKHGISPVTYVTDELNNETNKRGSDGLLDPIYDEDGYVINPYRTTERTGYGDNNLKIAGTKEFSVATWVRQKNSMENTIMDEESYSDLSVMLNQAEIYASIWTGDKWTECRLTDNCTGDFAPVVSVNDKYAIVAWRNAMGSDTDNPLNFNVKDIINARIYDRENNSWSDTVTLYNGQTGAVDNIETAMMSNGTAMVAYSIKTTEDMNDNTDTEVMYTIVNKNGEVLDCTRVTNNREVDYNIQLQSVNFNGKEHFILGWYNEAHASQIDEEGNLKLENDIRLLAVDEEGIPSSELVESLRAAGAEIKGSDFKFSKPVKDASIDDLSIVWMHTVKPDADEEIVDEGNQQEKMNYVISAMRFLQHNGSIRLSAPMIIAKLDAGKTIDSFSTYGDKENLQTVLQSTNYEVDINDPASYYIKYYDEDGEVQVEDEDAKNLEDLEKVIVPIGKTSMYTVSSKYKLCSVEAEEPLFNQNSFKPGFDMPVGFTVKNNGLYDIDKVVISLDGKETEYDIELLSGQSKELTAYYEVPRKGIHDVEYTIKAFSGEKVSNPKDCTGVLKLNVPDVSISNMEIVKEEEKTRTIQVTLDNAGNIPLKDGGKQIVVGLYDVNPDKDENAKPMETVTIKNNDELALVDAHSYQHQFTLSEDDMDRLLKEQYTDKELESAHYEIPKSKMIMYAKATILDGQGKEEEEFYTHDNQQYVEIQSLVDKYQSDVTVSTRIAKDVDSADAIVTVQNNSFVNKICGNIVASLADKNGKVISKTKQTYDAAKGDKGIIRVPEEATEDIKVHFTKDDLLEGYSMEDAATICATYGAIEPGDLSAKLNGFSVPGQQVDINMFDVDNKKVKPEIIRRKVDADGNEKESYVEVHQSKYVINKVINDKQLQTFVSVVPKNPEDKVKIVVNGRECAIGNGAQITDIKLSSQENTISVIVDGDTFKRMEVTRVVELKDKDGKVIKDSNQKIKTKKVKERYELNEDGKAIDENGTLVDLTAKDVVGYEVITVQNESVYTAVLTVEIDEIDDIKEKLDKDLDLSKLVLLLKANMKKNKQGKETTCQLTWNAIPGADGYLVYGAKCNTANKSYPMKRLALLKGNGTLSFTQKALKQNQSYKYLVKAYRMVEGKREIIALSYVVRTYAGDKASIYGNPVKVTVKKSDITVKLGKTVQIEAVVQLPKGKKKKKQGPEKRYISTDKSIAWVTTTGKIKAKKKGKCYVYVIAQNGVRKKIKVVVR